MEEHMEKEILCRVICAYLKQLWDEADEASTNPEIKECIADETQNLHEIIRKYGLPVPEDIAARF